ncbi:cytochrome b5-like [Cylas formicarius]|uniref:cytochrome b5-like n=1 Tax=Cylas formicarius TaxID=197179 RepID=UPI0029583E7B|nr:cytochrome b5-like [Cylas formicarius]
MAQQTETKYYTWEEIKNHDGEIQASVWIVYKNNVYDVTEYMEDHPGGAELVTEWAGKDCTKAFDDFGHSSDAKKQLKPLKIGELAEEDRKTKDNKKKGDKKNGVANTKEEKTNGVTVIVSDEKPQMRSCFSIITCGLCA